MSSKTSNNMLPVNTQRPPKTSDQGGDLNMTPVENERFSNFDHDEDQISPISDIGRGKMTGTFPEKTSPNGLEKATGIRPSRR